MEILISKEDYIIKKDTDNLAWMRTSRKLRESLLLTLVLGLVLLITGIISPKETNFWNFRTSFGIGFLLLAGLNALKIYEIKKTLFSSHKYIETSGNIFQIKIDNEGIFCSSLNSSTSLKWDFFKYYQLYNGFFVFYSDNSQLYSFVINEKDLAEKEQEELKNFLTQKLKIKS